MMDIAPYLAIFVRQPLFLAEALLLGAILSGFGRSFGIPMLFWDQRRGRQFWAGLSVGLFMCDGIFVTYELERPEELAVIRLEPLLVASPLVLLIGVGLARTIRRLARSFAGNGRSPVAPAVYEYKGTERTCTRPNIPVLPFLGGTLLALVAALSLEQIGLRIMLPLSPPVVIFGLLLFAFTAFYKIATPAVASCVLLAITLGAYGGIEHEVQNPGVSIVIVLFALAAAGTRLYKVRLPTFEPSGSNLYAKPLPYPPRDDPGGPSVAGLLPFDVGLDARAAGQSAPLILVCVSGGGIRAAAWTAGILGLLDEQLPQFRGATRLLTGASGGGVGAAAWWATARTARKASPHELIDAVAEDSLTPAVRSLVFYDIPWAFLPFVNRRDRGRSLEQTWIRNVREKCHADLSVPLSTFRPLEEEACLPSLVFSPMIVEDGRRLIVSNLNLSEVTDNRIRWLSSAANQGQPDVGVASRTAYHVCQLVRGGADLPLSTGARLAAAFPFVSPAIVLPTRPRRRVVDAGYFDNYGLDLACAWLRLLAEQRGDGLKDIVSKVLVIQVRDNVSNLSINPDSDERLRSSRSHGWLLRGLEGLTSPPEALAAARESVMLFRNDGQLGAIAQLYQKLIGTDDALSTTVFEFSGDASLSWHLTSEEKNAIRSQVDSQGIGGKVKAVDRWLGPARRAAVSLSSETIDEPMAEQT